MAVTRVPVSQVTGLHTTTVGPTSVALAWKAPAKGTPPIHYSVFYRKTGVIVWAVGARTDDTKATVSSLHPSTKYEFEIFCRNQ